MTCRNNTRFPREFNLLDVRAAKSPDEWVHGITYSRARGFFEPITNQAAEPVIGRVIEWRYA